MSSSVLLVNSVADERDMYVEFLHHSGIPSVDVCEADDAFTIAATARPDVIVTDIVLPRQRDGIALIERLRRDDRTQDVSIIVVTGWVMGQQRETALRAGCDVFLMKPCLPADLLREIRRAFKKSRGAEQGRRR
jgi:CheY-like chemotaxis protein